MLTKLCHVQFFVHLLFIKHFPSINYTHLLSHGVSKKFMEDWCELICILLNMNIVPCHLYVQLQINWIQKIYMMKLFTHAVFDYFLSLLGVLFSMKQYAQFYQNNTFKKIIFITSGGNLFLDWRLQDNISMF